MDTPTTEPTETTEAPKPKRTYTRRKKPAAAAPAPRKTNELAGISATECCAACKVERCVISGKPYCAHPRKGSLHAGDMGNLEAIARLNAAKKAIGR